LVKVPLGCLAFFLGGATIFVLFMPWAMGRVARDWLTQTFDESYEGSLEVGHTWVSSLYGSQWIEGIQLRDPEGRVVIEGKLHAPSLSTWFYGGHGEGEEWGPVRISISRIHIQEDAAGVTNLARALTPRREGMRAPWDLRAEDSHIELRLNKGLMTMPDPGTIRIRVEIDRFTWETPETAVSRRDLLVKNVLLDGEMRMEKGMRILHLQGTGELPPGPPDNAGGEIAIDWTVDPFVSFEDLAAGGSWNLSIGATGALASDLDLLFGVDRQFESAFGTRIDEAHLRVARESRAGVPGLRVASLELRSDDARLHLEDGWRHPGGMLEAGPEGLLAIRFPVGGWWTDEGLHAFLPLCADLRPVNPTSWGLFELRFFELGPDRLLGGSSGAARVELPAATWALPVSLRRKLQGPAAEPHAMKELLLRSRLEGGLLRFDSQTLFAEGVQLGYAGTYDAARDALLLQVEWPLSWAMGLPLDDVEGGELSVTGSLEAMELEIPNR